METTRLAVTPETDSQTIKDRLLYLSDIPYPTEDDNDEMLALTLEIMKRMAA